MSPYCHLTDSWAEAHFPTLTVVMNHSSLVQPEQYSATIMWLCVLCINIDVIDSPFYLYCVNDLHFNANDKYSWELEGQLLVKDVLKLWSKINDTIVYQDSLGNESPKKMCYRDWPTHNQDPKQSHTQIWPTIQLNTGLFVFCLF